MKYRVSVLIETLKKLKPPRCVGAVIRVQLPIEPWICGPYTKDCDEKSTSENVITVHAIEVHDEEKAWLEWTIDL